MRAVIARALLGVCLAVAGLTCGPGTVDESVDSLAKVLPIGVSSEGAWKLFDRSIAREGLQLAYEWGLRHSPKVSVMIGEIPMKVVKSLPKGAIRVLPIPGTKYTQLVFDPSSFPVVNQALKWLQIIDK